MSDIHFTIDFPEGGMTRPGSSLRDWTAVGIQASGSFVTTEAIPAGSTLTLTEVIPDTYAHVSPIRGTGYVLPFTNEYTLTITPPTEPVHAS